MNNLEWLEEREKKSVHNEEMARYRHLFDVAKKSVPNPPDAGEQWLRLQKEIALHPQPSRRNWAVPALALAAALVISFLGFLWYQWTQPTIYLAMAGERITVALPDASSVELNAESTLTVAHDFNRQHREVTLEGEAFFEVHKGRFPFLVKTDIAEIQVVGTQFNVRAREAFVEVGVTEGEVEVTFVGEGSGKERTLKAGEWVACNRFGFIEQEVKPLPQGAQFPSWRRGELLFEDHALSRVVRELERFYDIEIVLATDPTDLLVTGWIKGESPENAVKILCGVIDKDFRRLENGTYIIE